MQPRGHTQLMVRMVDYGQNPQAAIDGPRFRIMSGLDVNRESSFPPATVSELARRGHLAELPEGYMDFGCAQIALKVDGGYVGVGSAARLARGRVLMRSDEEERTKPSAVLHVAPEAAVGGPLALVRTGDEILLDVPNRQREILVPEEELNRRRAAWRPSEPAYRRGYGKLFLDHSCAPLSRPSLRPRVAEGCLHFLPRSPLEVAFPSAPRGRGLICASSLIHSARGPALRASTYKKQAPEDCSGARTVSLWLEGLLGAALPPPGHRAQAGEGGTQQEKRGRFRHRSDELQAIREPSRLRARKAAQDRPTEGHVAHHSDITHPEGVASRVIPEATCAEADGPEEFAGNEARIGIDYVHKARIERGAPGAAKRKVQPIPRAVIGDAKASQGPQHGIRRRDQEGCLLRGGSWVDLLQAIVMDNPPEALPVRVPRQVLAGAGTRYGEGPQDREAVRGLPAEISRPIDEKEGRAIKGDPCDGQVRDGGEDRTDCVCLKDIAKVIVAQPQGIAERRPAWPEKPGHQQHHRTCQGYLQSYVPPSFHGHTLLKAFIESPVFRSGVNKRTGPPWNERS